MLYQMRHNLFLLGRSIITKKSDGSQVKESTDSSTTLEDDDVKGKMLLIVIFYRNITFN